VAKIADQTNLLAFEKHTPIRFYALRSRGALDYKLLADEVLSEIGRRGI